MTTIEIPAIFSDSEPAKTFFTAHRVEYSVPAGMVDALRNGTLRRDELCGITACAGCVVVQRALGDAENVDAQQLGRAIDATAGCHGPIQESTYAHCGKYYEVNRGGLISAS